MPLEHFLIPDSAHSLMDSFLRVILIRPGILPRHPISSEIKPNIAIQQKTIHLLDFYSLLVKILRFYF